MSEVDRVRGDVVKEEEDTTQPKPQYAMARQLQAHTRSLQPLSETSLWLSTNTQSVGNISV